MKHILVPVDFSDAANNAANYALEMAMEINVSITLIHIYNIPIYYGDVPILATDNDKILLLKSMLADLKKNLLQKAKVNIIIDTKFVVGDFLDELKMNCDEYNPYCVVMGCQGKTAFENIFFGSNAINAIKHIYFPLLLIPYDASFALINHIGIACDFEKDVDAKNIKSIIEFATDFDSEIYICNIGQQNQYNLDLIGGVAKLTQQLSAFKTTKYFIADTDVEDGLENFIKECKLDALIIFPKQYNFLENIWHSSVSKKMVLHSSVPILSMHYK
jgi:nucleotide-binding universal stress UspA family protein